MLAQEQSKLMRWFYQRHNVPEKDSDESEGEDDDVAAAGESDPATEDSEAEDESDSPDEAPVPLRRPAAPAKQVAKPPPTKRARPTLVAADESDDENLSHARSRPLALEDRAKQTFAQRARQAASGGVSATSSRRSGRADAAEDDGDDIVRGAPGGGMEMSFIPQAKATDEVAEKRKAQKEKRDKEKKDKASFGMGLERTSGAANGTAEAERELEGDEGSGRTKMRKPARSASRNKTRFL